MGTQISIFIQQIINGLKIGSVYALVALGYTMVYGIIKLINFAHGDFIMVGSYVLLYTIPIMVAGGLPAWAAVILAIIACSAVGITVEKPVREKGTKMSALITAIAMSLFLENLAQTLFGASPKSISTIFNFPNLEIGGTKLNGNTLLTIAIGVVMMIALQLFVKKTKMGKAMRAVSEDGEAAILMGINKNRTISITFAIGSALAAVASLMYCASYPQATPTLGSMLGLKAFVAAVLGGIGSIPGAMIGGMAIGLLEALVSAIGLSVWKDGVVFAILIVVLLVKPTGIMGHKTTEKV